MANSQASQQYLSVTGEIHPERALSINGDRDYKDYDMVPVIDKKSRNGFFVHTRRGAYGGQPTMVTLTGMRRGIDSDLHGDLDRIVGQNSRFNARMELVAGQAPGDLRTNLWVMLGTGLVGGLL